MIGQLEVGEAPIHDKVSMHACLLRFEGDAVEIARAPPDPSAAESPAAGGPGARVHGRPPSRYRRPSRPRSTPRRGKGLILSSSCNTGDTEPHGPPSPTLHRVEGRAMPHAEAMNRACRSAGRDWSAAALGRADLHVHSWWSDGAQSPEEVVRAAAGRVDVLALTDHDEIAGALRAREFARDHPALGVDVVIGEEVSTLNGHLLALFLEERVPPGLSAERTIELIHEQDGLAVVAHPFHPIRYRRLGRPSLAALIPHLPLDGIEVV